MTAVCLAGATGWTGRAIGAAILDSGDLTLASAVGRTSAGRDLGEAWGGEANGIVTAGDIADALGGVDVMVDYTSPGSARRHALTAIDAGVHVVIGTSGLTAANFEEIDAAARAARVGVVAAGNFSVTAAMAQAAALLVAPHLPHREIIDYASASKQDAPSGTSRELAERLADVPAAALVVPINATIGEAAARGATIAGTQVHSLRLPSFVVSTEIVFAMPDGRLTIRHDAGGTPAPYVAGTLLAIRAVSAHVGLIRGLDTLLLSRF